MNNKGIVALLGVVIGVGITVICYFNNLLIYLQRMAVFLAGAFAIYSFARTIQDYVNKIFNKKETSPLVIFLLYLVSIPLVLGMLSFGIEVDILEKIKSIK